MSKGGGSVDTPQPSDYMPLVNAQANANRINQSTPFGSIKYKTVGAEDPMGFNKWQKQNPAPRNNYNDMGGGDRHSENGGNRYNARSEYNDYLDNFDPGGRTEAVQSFSPELQNLFNQQFNGDSYNQYADEYMGRYNELIEPGRTNQMDQFQQGMFNRGLPEGSDVYGDVYRETVGDPNARQDLMATQAAQGLGDQRKLQDFNRLMAAMGGSQVNTPPIDVMGAANMGLNANMTNANNAQQGSSSMWNTAGQAATSAAMIYAMCSRDYKENKEPVDTLDKLMALPVERWDYKLGIADGGRHISPYAEDFREAFGVGDGKTIAFIDMIGVLMRSVQELAAEVRELKCQQ